MNYLGVNLWQVVNTGVCSKSLICDIIRVGAALRCQTSGAALSVFLGTEATGDGLRRPVGALAGWGPVNNSDG